MHDHVRRQLLQGLQVVAQRLLDQMAFLHAGRADMPLEEGPLVVRETSAEICVSFSISV